MWAGYGSLIWPYVNVVPPVYDVYLSYPLVIKVERGKSAYPPRHESGRQVNPAHERDIILLDMRRNDAGRSKCFSVVEKIRSDFRSGNGADGQWVPDRKII